MGLVNIEFAAMSQGNDKSALDKINAFLDDESSKIGEIFKLLNEKTGVPKIYLAGGIAALLVVLILFCFGAPLLCNVVGFIYPAYASFKSLNSKSTDKSTDDDRQWLTYWVVYCCFSLIEGFLEYILFWVPFYYPIKLAFLFYLFLPQTQGAMQIYSKFLQPLLHPYVAIIDGAASAVANKANSAAAAVNGTAQGAVGKESVKAD